MYPGSSVLSLVCLCEQQQEHMQACARSSQHVASTLLAQRLATSVRTSLAKAVPNNTHSTSQTATLAMLAISFLTTSVSCSKFSSHRDPFQILYRSTLESSSCPAGAHSRGTQRHVFESSGSRNPFQDFAQLRATRYSYPNLKEVPALSHSRGPCRLPVRAAAGAPAGVRSSPRVASTLLAQRLATSVRTSLAKAVPDNTHSTNQTATFAMLAISFLTTPVSYLNQ
jgi:hypothetical protein